MSRVLWIASANRKKRLELERLLQPLGFDLRGLEAAPQPVRIVEDAPDFAGNARIKAVTLARAVGAPALGDDSGLCVDALGGRPGVLSARYAGADASDDDRVAKILAELRDVPQAQRTARFVCALCVADASGQVLHEVQDTCEGSMASSPRGGGGFGYDPIFVPDATRSESAAPTMAELGAAEKDVVSHRGRALRRLADWLAHRA
ncbi:MAG: non-canonical purine NTP pyrophosphatase [Planctomycetota bacterium]